MKKFAFHIEETRTQDIVVEAETKQKAYEELMSGDIDFDLESKNIEITPFDESLDD